MTVAQDKTGVGAGSMEWQTPPDLFAWLDQRFKFDYDAFASHENALCDHYSTIDGTFRLFDRTVHPDNDLAEGERRPVLWHQADGLNYPWADLSVYINPPYSRGLIEQCIQKAYNERNNAAIIVALVPASTETQWFQKYLLHACHIEWLPGRVLFIDPDTGEPGQSPPSGSAIAIFRQDYK